MALLLPLGLLPAMLVLLRLTMGLFKLALVMTALLRVILPLALLLVLCVLPARPFREARTEWRRL